MMSRASRLLVLLALLATALVVGSIQGIDRHSAEDTSRRVIVEVSAPGLVRVTGGPTSRDQTGLFEGPLFVDVPGEQEPRLFSDTTLGMFRAILHAGLDRPTIQVQADPSVPWTWIVRLVPIVSQAPHRLSAYAFRLGEETDEVRWTLPPATQGRPREQVRMDDGELVVRFEPTSSDYVHYHLRRERDGGIGPFVTFVDRVPGLVSWPDDRPGPIDNGFWVPMPRDNPLRLGPITPAALEQRIREALDDGPGDPITSVIVSAAASDDSRVSYGDAWRFLDACQRAGATRIVIKLARRPLRVR